MKSIVFLALIGYAYGVVIGHYGSGQSSQFRNQDNIGNYAFGYNEDHATGGTFRREQGGPGVMVGSYGLRDADGRNRVVNYVADAAGFRANIQTNEPGVEPKDPAAVLINKAEAIVAPAVHAPLIAPAVHSYAAPGVIAHHAPLSHASYSTSVQHVPSVYGHYGVAGLAAPLTHYASPISYATKTIHGVAPYGIRHW